MACVSQNMDVLVSYVCHGYARKASGWACRRCMGSWRSQMDCLGWCSCAVAAPA